MRNLLLVDNDKEILEILDALLQRHLIDTNIFKAESGKDAVRILDSRRIDLIVIDLQMPGMDGYELAEFKNCYYPHIPLIAMTSELFPESNEKLHALGVSQYIPKPFDIHQVTKKIMNEMLQWPDVPLYSVRPSPVMAWGASIERG